MNVKPTNILFLLLGILMPLEKSSACINVYRTLLDGSVVYTEPTRGKVTHSILDTSLLRQQAKELEADYERTDSIEYLSDLAATLTYLGKYQRAKNIYHFIERKKPNLYTTASNLGTLYELLGHPDSALILIDKSIKLHPESHQGSEWIHVKILEHKLSGNTVDATSVLDLDFGNGLLPANPQNLDLERLGKHIFHQLKERTAFVKPKNFIVGSLYFDLGNVLAQTRSIEAALESYEAADEYGFQSDLMKLRMETFRKMSQRAKPAQIKDSVKIFIMDHIKLLLVCGLTLLVLMVYQTIRILR